MTIPCCPLNFFSSFWWILSARSDVETLAVTDAVAAAEGVGDAVGACANKPMTSAIQQMQTMNDFFTVILWSEMWSTPRLDSTI